MPTLPTPNKTPGDGAPADDMNLVIEAINTLQSQVDNIPAGPQGPQGEPGTPGAAGAAATITVASTVTTEPGANASVTQSGTAQNAQLTFYIPRGETGPTGATGSQGPIGPTGPQGPVGPAGPAVNISDATPSPLGTAGAGSSPEASRSDHVHAMPSAANVGAIATTARGAANGVASLDSTGKVPTSELPAIAITETFVVASQAAMLALSAQIGDVAIRTDVNLNFILADTPASVLGNWVQLLTPPDAVTSVDGRVGVVTLSDLYDASGAAATVAGNLSTHEADTTSVHGISNTANLVYTNDPRLTDARTPTAHAATHGSAGSDPVTIANTQVTGLGTASTVNVPAAGNAAVGEAVLGSDTRLSDQRTPLDGSVTTAKIVDANVTNAKLANSSITINGSAVSLGGSVTISGLPSQTGNQGEYLTTDGTNASWAPIVTDPTPTLFLLGGM